MQPLYFAERQIGSGRIIGIGQEHHARALRHRIENGVGVGHKIPLGRYHRHRPIGLNGDRIDQKTILTVNSLVTGPQIGVGQKLQQFVGAGAAHDSIRLQPIAPGDGLAQRRGRTVGIKLELAGRGLIGGDGSGTGAQGRFIGRQFMDLCSLGAALSRNIGLDAENAGAGLRAEIAGDMTHETASMGQG